jgi:hypothetical protein
VRYVRSTYIPEGEKCYCLFEGSSREAVEEVHKRAGLPYEKVHGAATRPMSSLQRLQGKLAESRPPTDSGIT